MRSVVLHSVLAAGSGVLLVAAFEPFALGPVGWVALVPLLVAVARARRVRSAAGYGLVTGLVFFGAHLSWILLFGWMAWTALTLALALYVAVACAGARLVRRLPLAPVLVAGWWVALELARGSWPWGGFAWSSLGTSQAGVPGVRWLAGSIGAYGLSFLCAFVSGLIADRLVNGRLSWGSIALVGAGVLAFAATDALTAQRQRPREVDIAVVQGSVPRPVAVDQEERVFESHVRLTRALARSGRRPDVVVWPESAVGYLDEAAVRPVLTELGRALDRPLLVGRTRENLASSTFRNLVEQVAPSGRTVAVYQKRRAVPFGERVPIGFLRRYVTTLSQVPLDMAPGRRSVVFDAGGVRVSTPICFESVFPADVRTFVRAGAQLVVVSTNDASFERSAASMQHLAHARMRAIEHRRWVVQAAISGVSAVVSPDGAVVRRTSLFRPATLRARVEARTGPTLYTRVGDLFAWKLVAFTMLATLLGVALRPRRPFARARRRPSGDEQEPSATAPGPPGIA